MDSITHIASLVGGIVALLLISVAAVALTKRLHVPLSLILVVVGITIGYIGGLDGGLADGLAGFELSPGVILFVFLPTLIFESAFHLDARYLRRNLAPVLMLAVPGLILSTAIIGAILKLVTPFDWPVALLIGAILSATDPVAVLALFKEMGAPKRLTVLIEGESLFNDATSIVVSRILVGVVLAGVVSPEAALSGVVDFLVVFLGGVLVGWALAIGCGWLLGMVENDSFIEISLTTVLAYLSFLMAEEVFHVSGVMATVAAGVTIGGWGRTKITPRVVGYMENFWGYMASLANALIFLLVGLRVDMGALAGSLETLAWVIVAMLVSRACVTYTLIPIVGRLPGSEPVNRAYQTVIFWGGLRGAIALALALSLEGFAEAETIVVLVMGAVLFTLLVPGLSTEWLMHRLGMDQPPLADRVARLEGLLTAKRQMLQRIPELNKGGVFSARIAQELERKGEDEAAALRNRLDTLRGSELRPEQELQFLLRRMFASERTYYYELFTMRHLSEPAYRTLSLSVDIQMERLRYGHALPASTLRAQGRARLHRLADRAFEFILGFTGIPEYLREARIAHDYEIAWGRQRATERILAELDEMERAGYVHPDLIAVARGKYNEWLAAARKHLDEMAEQFPEFVTAMQERLARRLMLHVQEQVIEKELRAGLIPDPVAETMLDELFHSIEALGDSGSPRLKIDASELLRKVPFFREMNEDDFSRCSGLLNYRTVPTGEIIIKEGERSDSLFLIARGVVRVMHDPGAGKPATNHNVATLFAGDFFGEMALLHGDRRTATCRASTPTALYELRRKDFFALRDACPAIQGALDIANKQRQAQGIEA